MVASPNGFNQCMWNFCNKYTLPDGTFPCKVAHCSESGGDNICNNGNSPISISNYWNDLSASDKELHHFLDPGICIGSTCDFCVEGQSQPSENMPNCINCLAGKYQDQIKTLTCINCVIGQSQPATAKNRCVECATGKYVDVPAQPTCKSCPIGWKGTGTGGATDDTTCVMCLAGFVAGPTPGQAICKECDIGYYLPTGACYLFFSYVVTFCFSFLSFSCSFSFLSSPALK